MGVQVDPKHLLLLGPKVCRRLGRYLHHPELCGVQLAAAELGKAHPFLEERDVFLQGQPPGLQLVDDLLQLAVSVFEGGISFGHGLNIIGHPSVILSLSKNLAGRPALPLTNKGDN